MISLFDLLCTVAVLGAIGAGICATIWWDMERREKQRHMRVWKSLKEEEDDVMKRINDLTGGEM